MFQSYIEEMKGKVVLITGGGGHLGCAIASSLLELNCTVLLIEKNQSSVEKFKQGLPIESIAKLHMFEYDLENEENFDELLEAINQKFSKLDILINNAAFTGSSDLKGWATDFESQTVGTWRRALEVNLTAPFILVQKLLPCLEQSESPSIINIGSIYGVVGPDMSLYEGTAMGNPAAYAASKGGLLQLTRWMSTVLAPKIRVNMISPGGISRGQSENFSKKYIKKTPMARMANEEDFIGPVLFLSSSMSGYITGQNIVVDGGWTVW